MHRGGLHQNLRPFRWRIRIVLAWRYAAIGGALGTAVALLTDIGDWRGAWTAEPLTLVAFIVVGIFLGIAYAVWRPLPAEAIAQLIDRRAELKDRVTTALLCSDNPFVEPLREDALTHLASVRPSQVFPFRLTAWHSAMALLLIALLISRFLPQLPLPFMASLRQDRKEAKKMVEQVKRVLKPITEHAKEPEASRLEKRLAQQLTELYRRAQKGRLSKKEAMVKLNKLLSEAQKLERQAQQQIQRVSTKAVTAAQSLQQQLKNKALASQMQALQPLLKRMQELERKLQSQNLTPAQRQALQSELQMLQRTMEMMGQPNSQALQQHMEALALNIAQLQQMLQSGKDAQGRPLSEAEKKLLQQQLQSLQQQLRALRLSKQAQEFLRKLMNDPNFQEAMKRLAELQKQLGQMAQGQMPQISPEELERMLREMEKALEELAKQFGDDEKIRELAKQLLEAVERLKAGGT